jgi:predicted Fe-Mo cluster-binding NifX family protein
MRIAVPTDDGVTLSAHFGLSAAFLVFELENGQFTKRETRPDGGATPKDRENASTGRARATFTQAS